VLPVDSLDMLFNPEVVAKFADCGVTFLDSAEDVLQLALTYLGLRSEYHATRGFARRRRPC
jgi:spermidine/putrescine-binding protein